MFYLRILRYIKNPTPQNLYQLNCLVGNFRINEVQAKALIKAGYKLTSASPNSLKRSQIMANAIIDDCIANPIEENLIQLDYFGDNIQIPEFQEKILVKGLLQTGYKLTSASPNSLKRSQIMANAIVDDCIANPTEENLIQLDYFGDNIQIPEFQEKILVKGLFQAGYKLTSASPNRLKRSQIIAYAIIDVCINDLSAANLVQLNCLDDIKITDVQAISLIKAGYKLTESSPIWLRASQTMANALIYLCLQGIIKVDVNLENQIQFLIGNYSEIFAKLHELVVIENINQNNDNLIKIRKFLTNCLLMAPMTKEKISAVYEVLLRWEFQVKGVDDTSVFAQFNHLFNIYSKKKKVIKDGPISQICKVFDEHFIERLNANPEFQDNNHQDATFNDLSSFVIYLNNICTNILSNNDQETNLNILHAICMVYISICRENYVRDNMPMIEEKTDITMKINFAVFIKKIYETISTDEIIEILRIIDQSNLSKECQYLLNDEFLLKKCLDVKKNPQYANFSEDYQGKKIGAWIMELTKILIAGVEQGLFDEYVQEEDKTEIDTNISIDFISILANLNVSSINNNLLNNPTLMDQVSGLFDDLDLVNIYVIFSKMLGKDSSIASIATFLNFAYQFDFNKYYSVKLQEGYTVEGNNIIVAKGYILIKSKAGKIVVTKGSVQDNQIVDEKGKVIQKEDIIAVGGNIVGEIVPGFEIDREKRVKFSKGYIIFKNKVGEIVVTKGVIQGNKVVDENGNVIASDVKEEDIIIALDQVQQNCYISIDPNIENMIGNFRFNITQKLSLNERLKLVTDFIQLHGPSYRYGILFTKENFDALVSYRYYDTLEKNNKLSIASEMYRQAYSREKITVPPIRGIYETKAKKRIRVVLGDTANPINLTLGERTEACMRIGGHARVLFDVCLINKNGFHIRFEDPDTHKFISRVSGFRNGNTVFLNELMFSLDLNRYSNKDLREILIEVSKQLIEMTKESEDPIQNVVISRNLVMSNSVLVKLGDIIIDKGILECDYWYHNVNPGNATLLATSTKGGVLARIKLKRDTTEYDVLRMEPERYEEDEAVAAINHMLIVEDLLTSGEIDNVVLLVNGIKQAIVGEDWFAYSDGLEWKCKVINGISATKREIAQKEMEKYLGSLGIPVIQRMKDNNLDNSNSDNYSTDCITDVRGHGRH